MPPPSSWRCMPGGRFAAGASCLAASRMASARGAEHPASGRRAAAPPAPAAGLAPSAGRGWDRHPGRAGVHRGGGPQQRDRVLQDRQSGRRGQGPARDQPVPHRRHRRVGRPPGRFDDPVLDLRRRGRGAGRGHRPAASIVQARDSGGSRRALAGTGVRRRPDHGQALGQLHGGPPRPAQVAAAFRHHLRRSDWQRGG